MSPVRLGEERLRFPGLIRPPLGGRLPVILPGGLLPSEVEVALDGWVMPASAGAEPWPEPFAGTDLLGDPPDFCPWDAPGPLGRWERRALPDPLGEGWVLVRAAPALAEGVHLPWRESVPLRAGARYRLTAHLAANPPRGGLRVRLLSGAGAPLLERRLAAPGAVALDLGPVPPGARLHLAMEQEALSAGQAGWIGCASLALVRLGSSPGPLPISPRDAEEARLIPALDAEGAQGWWVPLPPGPQGQEGLGISATLRRSGRPLCNAPLTIAYREALLGAVLRLSGSTVVGWALDGRRPDRPLPVRLFVDGHLCGEGLADREEGDRRGVFRLPLPPAVMDGAAHRIAVRLANDRLVGEIADLLPTHLTPWPVLAGLGGAPQPAALSPVAAWRYAALEAHLAAIAAGSPRAEPAMLHAAHARLVHGQPPGAPLRPPVSALPAVSVLLRAEGASAEAVEASLAGLLLACNALPFEVIVVGGTAEGVPCADHLDHALALARGHWLAFLDAGSEPTLHWLDELVHAFDRFAGLGLAAARLIGPDGRLKAAGGAFGAQGIPMPRGEGVAANEPAHLPTREVGWLPGNGLMLPRDVWPALQAQGALDPGGEDAAVELALRARAAGRRVAVVPGAAVLVTAPPEKPDDEPMRPEAETRTLRRRWGAAWRRLARDPSPAFRALVIDAQVPRPDSDAGSHAAVQEMRCLQALGGQVAFVPQNLAWLGRYSEDLQRMGIEAWHAPHALSVEDLLQRRGAELDLVYITRYRVAERHIAAVRRHAPRAKILFCNADLHFLRELRAALRTGDAAPVEAALATRDAELSVIRAADLTLSYSPVEQAVIDSHVLGAARVMAAPWIAEVVEEVPGFAVRSGVAFLGGFGHPPNEEAVRFFVAEVMPLLRRRAPGLVFTVHGSRVPPGVEALAAPDVRIAGHAPTLGEVFDPCRVFVAPLLSGAGLKGKVVDAMRHGVPCVLSPLAAEGIPLSEGREALIAEEPARWVEAIMTLHEDDARWAAMSAAAQALVRRHYGFAEGVERMRAALDHLGVPTGEGMASRHAGTGRRPAAFQ